MASEIKYCAKCERCHDYGLRADEECEYYGEPCGCSHPNRGFAESANDTVADIIAINQAIYQGCEECSLSDKDVKWFLDLIDRFEAAHQREVAVVLKDRDEMFKSEQETVAKTKEWFDEYQKLKREVAELRNGISELLDALQSIYEEECTSYGTEEVYDRWRKALREEGA